MRTARLQTEKSFVFSMNNATDVTAAEMGGGRAVGSKGADVRRESEEARGGPWLRMVKSVRAREAR